MAEELRPVSRYPAGAAAELLDGTLKLRYCTTSFSSRFPSWSLPWNGAGERDGVTTSHLLDDSGNVVIRVGLTRKTRPGTPVHFRPGPGLPTPKRWKGCISLIP